MSAIKPHERIWKAVTTEQGTWVREPSDKGPAYEPSVCMVYSEPLERLPNESGAAHFRRTEEATADVAALIAASPDMARALLRLYMAFPEKAMTTEEQADSLNGARAALRKAKVLP